MTRALVIYGDPAIGGVIADSKATRELEIVRAELRKMQARDGVRRYGDGKRWQDVRNELAEKYSTRPAGRVTGAIMGVYGLFLESIRYWYEYFAKINRSA